MDGKNGREAYAPQCHPVFDDRFHSDSLSGAERDRAAVSDLFHDDALDAAGDAPHDGAGAVQLCRVPQEGVRPIRASVGPEG